MSTHTIPDGFWQQIDHQLERIKTEKPDTFAKVRAILTDRSYTTLDGYGYDKGHEFAGNHAFFGGSGGEATLSSALRAAGWHREWSEASYFYVMRHGKTGARLTYIEGDVYEGNRSNDWSE